LVLLSPVILPIDEVPVSAENNSLFDERANNSLSSQAVGSKRQSLQGADALTLECFIAFNQSRLFSVNKPINYLASMKGKRFVGCAV